MNSFVIMAITDIIIDQTIRYAIGFLTEQPEPHLGDIGGFMLEICPGSRQLSTSWSSSLWSNPWPSFPNGVLLPLDGL